MSNAVLLPRHNCSIKKPRIVFIGEPKRQSCADWHLPLLRIRRAVLQSAIAGN
jgi:hypothetical protein